MFCVVCPVLYIESDRDAVASEEGMYALYANDLRYSR